MHFCLISVKYGVQILEGDKAHCIIMIMIIRLVNGLFDQSTTMTMQTYWIISNENDLLS